MNKSVLKTALCIAVLLVTATVASAQQSKQNADLDYIEVKQKRLNEYQRDFLDFSTSHKRDIEERGLLLQLAGVASTAQTYLDSIWNLVYINNNLSCKSDKAMVASLAEFQIKHYIKTLALEISTVNNNISFTKIPAVATSGTQLKDDLREIIAKLEAIKFN